MMVIDHSCRESSLVHQIDPRIKILTVIIFSTLILQANLTGLLAGCGLILGIAWIGRLQLLVLLRTLRPVLVFLGLLLLFYLFITPGDPLPGFPLGPLVITYAGLMTGGLLVGKYLLLILAGSVLTMTASPGELTVGIERLLRPFRFVGLSSHNIATMVGLALRFLPLLQEELTALREAQAALGADYSRSSIRTRTRVMVNLATPLALNVFRRCDSIVDAMEARGYQAGNRTYLHELRLQICDKCLLMVLAAVVIVALFL